jgi:hypothetical protein
VVERSIEIVPRSAVLLVLLAVLAAMSASTAAAAPVHVVAPDGSVRIVDDPHLPPPDPAPPAPSKAAARLAAPRAVTPRKTVGSELQRMLDEGAITPEQHTSVLRTYRQARSALRRVDGRSETELKSVMNMLASLASSGQLTPGRLPVVFEIVARNAEYWSGHSSLASGARVKFTGSRIVWQSYPGNGIQPQWLGTFGEANALAKSRKQSSNAALGEVLDQALALASPRAGGIAWESFFAWSGAPPVWVSALSQGTGIQALSRASVKLARPELLQAATAALGIFKTPAPDGVAVAADGGTHYLIYSTNPGLFVLNGFLQSLVGLFDYTQISQDPEGLALFAAGDRAAQAQIPRYDTGSWSLYEGTRESDLGYHQLVTGFLDNLCQRTQTPVYCDTALSFQADETEPPVLHVRTSKARIRKPVPITFTLSKISRVSLWVDGVPIDAGSFSRGTHTMTWSTGRKKPGQIDVRLTGTDLAGNQGSVEKIVEIARK